MKSVRISKDMLEWTINRAIVNKSTLKIVKKHDITQLYFSDSDISYKYEPEIKKTVFKNNKHKNLALLFFAQISKIVNNYIISHNLEIELIKEIQSTKVMQLNRSLFDNIEDNEIFYSIDINNAWFQSAYKLGVISEKMYNTYKGLPEFKALRQISFGLTTSETEVTYINPCIQKLVIRENKNLQKALFKNIKVNVYNTITECRNELLSIGTDCLSYAVDSITFTSKGYDLVYNYLNSNNWDFKVIICTKINSNSYLFGSELRKIK